MALAKHEEQAEALRDNARSLCQRIVRHPSAHCYLGDGYLNFALAFLEALPRLTLANQADTERLERINQHLVGHFEWLKQAETNRIVN
jgi:hypothetical protein